MMSARVASALALVSFSFCLAQESFVADSNASFPDSEPAIEEEVVSESESTVLKPSQEGQAASVTSMNTAFAEHISLENCRYGVVTSKRVRMRTAAQLDAPVIRELEKGTPLKITGEVGDFYTIIPPFPLKAYVFRTYVLDGKIEGERVNVRLGPSPEAAILTQLSSGHLVNGKPSHLNAKWLEIDLPATTRFYISKDYVQLVDETAFQQMAKSFHNVQEASKTSHKEKETAACCETPHTSSAITSHTEALHHAHKADKGPKDAKTDHIKKAEKVALNVWQAKEENLKNQWLLLHAPSTEKDYHDYQASSSKKLKGILEIYIAPEQAPGNYTLREGSKIIAIVYSDKIDLEAHIGHTIEVKAVERNNHNYAYPAFCVLEVQ